jgi:hypothetical protein
MLIIDLATIRLALEYAQSGIGCTWSHSKRRNRMKKLMTVALALAFLGATVAVSFAQDTPKKESKKSSKKKSSKKKEETPKKGGGV